MDKANLRENKNRIDYDYAVGHKVYIKNDGVQRKMDCPKEGPFEITELFTNGTVRIQHGNVNGCMAQGLPPWALWYSSTQWHTRRIVENKNKS